MSCPSSTSLNFAQTNQSGAVTASRRTAGVGWIINWQVVTDSFGMVKYVKQIVIMWSSSALVYTINNNKLNSFSRNGQS